MFNEKFLRRFFKKVVKIPGGCWEWTAAKYPSGHGEFYVDYKMKGAHRVSWEIHNGRNIPKGMYICHHCDNPPCVNPNHIYLGTASTNMYDAYARGRKIANAPRGEKQWLSKLKREDVLKIRQLAKEGVPQTKIQKEFNLSQSHTSAIVARTRWGWLK